MKVEPLRIGGCWFGWRERSFFLWFKKFRGTTVVAAIMTITAQELQSTCRNFNETSGVFQTKQEAKIWRLELEK